MKKYIEYAADIYEIYLQYIDKRDIHVYSIDESFIDATDYLKIYNLAPKQFAKKLTDEIAEKKHIPATVGIGTNMFLAKVALDITAKKVPDHMGYLDEEIFRDTLWHHTPITDFWQIAGGTARRLASKGIIDMYGVAHFPEDRLYKEFGINAELLIDHAWGRESCLMEDVKNYKSKNKSVSFSQILFNDYDFDKARIVMLEMSQNGVYELMRRKVMTDSVGIYVGYSKDVIPPTGGRLKMSQTTNLNSIIKPYVERIFDQTTDKSQKIRRLSLVFDNIVDQCNEGYDLFTNFEKVEKEKKSEEAVLKIMSKYGKNAVIRAADLQEGATTIIRNKLIGGHNGE